MAVFRYFLPILEPMGKRLIFPLPRFMVVVRIMRVIMGVHNAGLPFIIGMLKISGCYRLPDWPVRVIMAVIGGHPRIKLWAVAVKMRRRAAFIFIRTRPRIKMEIIMEF